MNKTPADFWMEDAMSLFLILPVTELMEKELQKYGIKLTVEQEDKIHKVILEVLESVSNGNYRSHN